MRDFTEGKIARQVIDFTLPIMLGNVLMSAYGIINLIWVGRLLGHKAVAAVAACLPIIMLMPAFLIGLGMATMFSSPRPSDAKIRRCSGRSCPTPFSHPFCSAC